MRDTKELFDAGIATFMGSPYVATRDARNYNVAVIGIPVDFGVSYRSGSRNAPQVIRRYSTWNRIDGKKFYNYDTGEALLSNKLALCDLGDLNIWPGDAERNQAEIRKEIRRIRSITFPLILGGDHSITYGAFIGCKEALKAKDLALLHFDAHNDVDGHGRHHLNLPRVSHGNPFRALIDEGHLKGCQMLSIGVRGLVNWKWHAYTRRKRINIITANEFNSKAPAEIIKYVTEALGSAEAIYLSFDIDCFDISAAPGTGTPEPNGLDVSRVLSVLRGLGRLPVKGFDLVELNPTYDPTGATSHLACEVLVNFLAFSLRKT